MAEESNIYLSMDQIFINIWIIDDDDEEESVQLKTHFWGYYAIPSIFSVSGKAATKPERSSCQRMASIENYSKANYDCPLDLSVAWTTLLLLLSTYFSDPSRPVPSLLIWIMHWYRGGGEPTNAKTGHHSRMSHSLCPKSQCRLFTRPLASPAKL